MYLCGWEQTSSSKLATESAIQLTGFASNLYFKFTTRQEMYGRTCWEPCFLLVLVSMSLYTCTPKVQKS